MIKDLPLYIPIVFALTTLVCLLLFYWVVRNARLINNKAVANKILVGMLIWLGIQAILPLNNIYNSNTEALPPKIVIFGILPALLLTIYLFINKKGRIFIDSLPLDKLTYLNVVRVPVELVLFWLFLHKAVPELMTFEGRNFDIIAGITAAFVAYFGLSAGKERRKLVLIWNFICLGLLINIIVHAFSSAPSPLQQLAFEQPNIAILNFPFSWLPTFVVPVVLFGHLVSIRQLLKT
jgi:hypothetical protein